MLKARAKMIRALVDWVAPYLKESGFKGVFPNYTRIRPGHLELITFQFSCCDPSFCVCVSKCPPGGIRFSNGLQVKQRDVTALHSPDRLYLGVQNGCTCHWFKYDARQSELRMKENFNFMTMYKDTPLKYKYIADDIVKLIEEQAEPWWQKSSAWWLGTDPPVYNKLFWEAQQCLQSTYGKLLKYGQGGLNRYNTGKERRKNQKFMVVD